MIPWIESHIIQLGPIALQTWGTFVAAGVLVGTVIAAKRAKRQGLDSKQIWDMAFWVFLAAMLGARIFHVIFYEPGYYLAHPFEVVDPRQPGFAIAGGLAAGVVVMWWFCRRRGLDLIAYMDTVAWGLPWGCGIGRIGCFLIHDHPGTLTSFIGAVRYPDGQVRHDLGLYLSVLGFSIGLVFLCINYFFQRPNRHPPVARLRPPAGFWIAAFLILDGVARFCFDFLRVIDRRYVGLTPMQWLLIPAVIGAGWFLFVRFRTSRVIQSSS